MQSKKMNKKKSISVHVKNDQILNASRILKITDSLIKNELFDKCLIIGVWSEGLSLYEEIDSKRVIIRIKTPLAFLMSKGYLKSSTLLRKIIAVWSVLIFHINILMRILKLYDSAFVSFHSPTFLIISPLIKVLRKINVIYCPHELESHRTGLTFIQRKSIFLIEKIFIRYVDGVIVVCRPILNWYKSKFKIKKIHVVQNVPKNIVENESLIKSTILREEFNIPQNHIIFIYQGVIDKRRDSDKLLSIFTKVSSNKHLVFMGYGSMVEKVKEATLLFDNIHYKSSVPMDKIIQYTSGADIGLFFLFEEPSLSYKLSFPNKFSEYILSGLPILISSFLIHLSELTLNNKIGWSLDPNDEDLINFINSLTFEDISEKSKYVSEFSKTLSWENEENELIDSYSIDSSSH